MPYATKRRKEAVPGTKGTGADRAAAGRGRGCSGGGGLPDECRVLPREGRRTKPSHELVSGDAGRPVARGHAPGGGRDAGAMSGTAEGGRVRPKDAPSRIGVVRDRPTDLRLALPLAVRVAAPSFRRPPQPQGQAEER